MSKSSSRNRSRSLVAAAVGAALALTAPIRAADTFIQSDDYKDGEEVVNVFLNEAEYARMYEDIERNDTELDWGWVRHSAKKAWKPKALDFQLTGKTARITYLENFAPAISLGLEEAVRSVALLALKRIGLEVVESEAGAVDYEVQIAIVDLKTSKTYAFVAMIDPFVELELKLVDTASAEPVLLVRHQSHGGDPAAAAAQYFNDLIAFLR